MHGAAPSANERKGLPKKGLRTRGNKDSPPSTTLVITGQIGETVPVKISSQRNPHSNRVGILCIWKESSSIGVGKSKRAILVNGRIYLSIGVPIPQDGLRATASKIP